MPVSMGTAHHSRAEHGNLTKGSGWAQDRGTLWEGEAGQEEGILKSQVIILVRETSSVPKSSVHRGVCTLF